MVVFLFSSKCLLLEFCYQCSLVLDTTTRWVLREKRSLSLTNDVQSRPTIHGLISIVVETHKTHSYIRFCCLEMDVHKFKTYLE